MKNYFRGWTIVFGFTFRQSISKAFKLVSTLVAILIIGAIILINIIAAKPEQKVYEETDNIIEHEHLTGISTIDKVVILDESGLPATDYKESHLYPNGEYFKNIEYITIEGLDILELLDYTSQLSNRSMAVFISVINGVFNLEGLIPHNSLITEQEARLLTNHMMNLFTNTKMEQIDLNDEQLAVISTPVITSYSKLGESTNELASLIKMIATMIFSFMMYIMLLLYGQTVSKSVSTEKTSKLMETLLTSLHPYAMITGKVLAVTSMAILQFLIWIGAGFIGLYGGNSIAHKIYPGYENSIITFINFIKDNIGQTGMTLPAFILGVLIFGIGFLFYCNLASLAGCMVSKPEDVASTQGLFQIPIIISWIICYFAPLTGKTKILSLARYIPFTSPFCLPADLITGTIGLGEGILSLLVLTVSSFLIIILSSKIYKGLVLYNGQKANMKVLINILRS